MVAVVDFDQLVGDQVQVGLSGMLQSCLLLARLDGQVGNPTAGTLVMNINNPSGDLVPIAGVGSAPFARPAGAHLLSLTAEPFTPGVPGQTSGRVVTLADGRRETTGRRPSLVRSVLTVPALIKITAANDDAEATCRLRSKTVTLRTA